MSFAPLIALARSGHARGRSDVRVRIRVNEVVTDALLHFLMPLRGRLEVTRFGQTGSCRRCYC